MRHILVLVVLMSGPVLAADPVAEMYLHQVKLVEDDVLSLARAMPAEKYRRAMTSLTENNQLEPIQTYFGPMARSAVAAGVAYHSFNHYGQMVVYARMNGVVPPSSQPSPPPARE